MPTLATHVGAAMSSIITDHNASNVPIITKSASPMMIAPSSGRMRNKSNATFCVGASSTAVSATCSCEIPMNVKINRTVMIRKGAARPNASAVTAEITGPNANPPTPALTDNPRLRPMLSGFAKMMMRRIAGSELPLPRPVRNRPSNKMGNEPPKAIVRQPMISTDMPKRTSFLAWPLSANGAIKTLAMKPVMKPAATRNPSFDSEMEYASR
ncbi:unannotated protein [freshwater metagenome]|uniref:Unannotated protein n=1 Tax=freshwater metagenome TaxID=449393 RepID=A0A6J6M1A5_9ZZZZ